MFRVIIQEKGVDFPTQGKSAEGYSEEPSAPCSGLTNIFTDEALCYIIRTFNLGLECSPSSR